MAVHVADYEAFRDRLTASDSAAMAFEIDDINYVEHLIECARAYLHDCDLEAAEDLRPTSDEEPIPDLIRSALDLLHRGIVATDEDLLAVGYAVLEKAGRRLDRQAEEESGSDPHPSE